MALPHSESWSYHEAFSRNIGWVTREEQILLRTKKVAIAGLGGVGGAYLIALVRLGIERFSLAEFDHFEIANFNRQAGAFTDSLGKAKLAVMIDEAKRINPNLEVKTFESGITESNVNEFLQGADLFIDGLDFFVLGLRQFVFAQAAASAIPAITVAPIGCGAAAVCFTPGSMSFADYFGLHLSDDLTDKAVRFLVGLAPTMMQMKYIADRGGADFEARRAPSLIAGVNLCTGFAVSKALQILLQRGAVYPAPYNLHFDAYLSLFKKTYVWRGHRHPMQKLKFYLGRRMLKENQKRNRLA